MIEATRLRMLQAMGIDVYLPRTAPGMSATDQDASESARGEAASRVAPLAIACTRQTRSAARLARFFQHLPPALGIQGEAIAWLDLDTPGAACAVMPACAYLVFGASMARALGAQLSTAQQSEATIAVTVEPEHLLGGAADKRALWQALKPIARRLRKAR